MEESKVIESEESAAVSSTTDTETVITTNNSIATNLENQASSGMLTDQLLTEALQKHGKVEFNKQESI